MSMKSLRKHLAVLVLAVAALPLVAEAQPPVFEFLAPAEGTLTNAASVTLTGQVTGAVSLSVDGAAVTLVGPGDFVAGPYALAADQARAFTIVATAAGGETATLTRTIVHDGTPPLVAVTAPSAGTLGSATRVSVTGTVSDPHLQGVSVNGVTAGVTAGTWSAEVPLREGTNVLWVRAEDAAGNVAEATRSVVLDTRAPALAISDPEPGTKVGEASYTVRGTAADPNLDRVEIGGQAAGLTGGTWSLAITLAEGDNTLTAEAFDTLGQTTTASVVVRRDSGAPQVHVDVPAEGLHTQAATVDVSGTVSGGDTVTVNGDPATVPGDGTFSILGVALVEGENVLRARVAGTFGLEGLHQRTVVRDNTAPTRISSDPLDGAEALPGSRFAVTFSEALAAPAPGAWRLELDDGTPLAATWSLEEAELTLSPSALLPPAASIRLVLTTAVNDLAGNAVAAEEVLSYSTAGGAGTPQLDPVPSYVCADSWTLTGTAPASALVEVAGGAGGAATRAAADGTWSVAVALSAGRLHHLVVTAMGDDGVVSPAVTAELVHDCRAPEVISSALAGDTVTVVFSEPVDAATTSGALTVSDAGSPLAGSVTANGAEVVWTAASALPAVNLRLDVDTAVADPAGNALAFAYTHFFESTAASSFFSGTVIDDATGRPLAGALVSVTASDGVALTPPLPEQTTAADGGFQVPVPAGTHDVSVTRPEYTPALRVTTTLVGEGTELFDPRLTPAAEVQTVDAAGAALDFGAGLVLDVPLGAVPGPTTVSATRLSGQGLPALMPYGWSPRGAVWLDLGADFTTSATLTLPVEAPNGSTLTVAELDLLNLQYRSLGDVQVIAGTVSFAVTALGGYVAVVADSGGLAPPAAVAGEVLGSAASPAGDEVTAATLSFEPEMVLPTQTSEGTAVYTLSAPVASGLPLTLSIQEQLTLLDGTPRSEVPYEADLALYHGDDGTPRSRFLLRPSVTAQTTPIQLGSEDVAVLAYDGETVRGNVLGPSGGSVTNDEGDRLAVPSGGLAEPTAITLTRRGTADLPLAPPAGGTVDGVVEIDLGGGTLQVPGTLSLKLDVPPTAGEAGLLLRVVDVGGTFHYRAVAELEPTATGWSTRAIDPADLPWPGVTAGGQYVFLRLAAAHAFVRGTALAVDGTPIAGALVSSPSVEWLQVSDSAGLYVLPVPVGEVTLDVNDPTNGNAVSYTISTTAGDERADLDPRLQVVGPRVEETTPVHGATVPAGLEPTIRFSEPVAPASLVAGIELRLDGVAQAIGFLTQGALVTVQPTAALLPGSTYELHVGIGVLDLAGFALSTPAVVSFTVLEVVLPNEIDPQRVTLFEPDANGDARILGAPGAVPADSTVWVENRSRFVSTATATAGQDGSFDFAIQAVAGGDVLLFHVLVPGANEVFWILGPYVSADGRSIWIGPEALTMTTSDGVTLLVDEGTFNTPTRVTLTPTDLADPPAAPVPVELAPVYTFDLDFGGAEARKPIQLRFPGSITAEDHVQLLSSRVDTLSGPAWMMYDLVWRHNGELTTEDADVLAPPAAAALFGEATAVESFTKEDPDPRLKPPADYKKYLPGVVVPGRYMVQNTLQDIGYYTVPTPTEMSLAIFSLALKGIVARVNGAVAQLLEFDAVLLPGILGDLEIEVRDPATNDLFVTLTISLAEPATIIHLSPDSLSDGRAPLPISGSPIRFFLRVFGDAATSGDFEPGLSYDYDPENTLLTVSGVAGAVDAGQEIAFYNLDATLEGDPVVTKATAAGDGSFNLTAPGRADRRYVLALGAVISAGQDLRIGFNEALEESLQGFSIRNPQTNIPVQLEPRAAGTTENVVLRPKTRLPAGQELELVLNGISDDHGNVLSTPITVRFSVAQGETLDTATLSEVRDMVRLGRLVFVAGGVAGLFIFDAADPANLEPYVYRLEGGVKVPVAMPFPGGGSVRGVATIPLHGLVVVVGGGDVNFGQLKILDPAQIDPAATAAGITGEVDTPEEIAILSDFFVSSAIISDQIGGVGTQLPSGTPQRVAVFSNNRIVRWLAGRELPDGEPYVLDPPELPPYTLTVNGRAEPGSTVNLTDLDSGTSESGAAAEDGSFSIALQVRPADRIELVRGTGSVHWKAGQAPGGLDVTPLVDPEPFVLTVGGQHKKGAVVTLRNLTRGRFAHDFVPWTPDPEVEDLDFEVALEVHPGDELELVLGLDGIAFTTVAGIAVSDLFSSPDKPVLATSNVAAYYTGQDDPALTLCEAPVSNLGAGALLDLEVVLDPEDMSASGRGYPLSLVALAATSGLVILKSEITNPTRISYVSDVCTRVYDHDPLLGAQVRGLEVLLDFPVDLDGDGETDPEQELRDLAITAHADAGILIYDITDREFPLILSVIPLPSAGAALSADAKHGFLHVAAFGNGHYVVDLKAPPSTELLDDDGDSVDDRVVETLSLAGNNNTPMLPFPELGLGFAGGLDRGLTSLALAKPTLMTLTSDPAGGRRQVTRLAPTGVPTGPEDPARQGSPTLSSSFHVMAYLPGFLGPQVTVEVIAVGPETDHEIDAFGGSAAMAGMPPTSLTVTLERLAPEAYQEGSQIYVSRDITAVASLCAAKEYQRTADEEERCERATSSGYFSNGGLEILSGDRILVRFAAATRAQLAGIYSDPRLDEAQVEITSVPWHMTPPIHAEPMRNAFYGTGDAAPGTLLHAGYMKWTESQLAIRGRGLDFYVDVTCHTATLGGGPFGQGCQFNLDQRIVELPNADLLLIDGAMMQHLYELQSDGTYKATGRFDDITRTSSGWVRVAAHKTVYRHDRSGRLTSIADAVKDSSSTGNEITLHYDGKSRLTTVIDTLDRAIDFSHDTFGHVTSITDFTGRKLEYEYDGHGRRLLSRTPKIATIDSPSAPVALETKCSYATPTGTLDEQLNLLNNVTSMTDAKDQIWLQDVTYGQPGPDDRAEHISSQNWGGFNVTYDVDLQARKTTVVDRRSNNCTYDFNEAGQVTRIEDPTSAVWQFDYDADGSLLEEILPQGGKTAYTLDTSGERRKAGNVLEIEVTPDSRGANLAGSGATLKATYEYHQETNRPTKIVDFRGARTEIERRTDGLPEKITTAAGTPEVSVTELPSYNDHGQLERLSNPNGHLTEYEYFETGTSEGYLKAIRVDPGGLDIEAGFETDDLGRVTKETNPRGVERVIEYNDLDLVTSVTEATTVTNDSSPQPALSYEHKYFYDPNLNVAKKEIPFGGAGAGEPLGKSDVFTDYNLLDYPEEIRVEHAAGQYLATRYEYNENFLVKKAVDPAGDSTEYFYDERNLLERTVSGASTSKPSSSINESYTYTSNRRRETYTNGRQAVWRSEYDGFDRLKRSEDPAGNYQTFSYDENGNPRAQKLHGAIEGLLVDTEMEYDLLDRPTLTRRRLWDTAGEGAGRTLEEKIRYDAASNVKETEDSLNRISSYEYDPAERLTKVTDPVGNYQQLTLDAAGNVTRVDSHETDPVAGGMVVVSAQSAFDALNRQVAISNVAGTSTAKLGARGLVWSRQDAVGNETTRTYDLANRLLEEVHPENVRIEREYSADSLLTKYVDSLSQETLYTYDGLDRLTSVSYADGTSEQYLEYDGAHNLTKKIDARGITFDSIYDAVNLRTSVNAAPPAGMELPGPRSQTFEYNGAYLLTRSTYGSIVTEHGYDSLLRKTSEVSAGRPITWTLDDVGNPTRTVFPSGYEQGMSFDSLDRPTAIGPSVAGDVTPRATYEYRGPGLLRRKTFGLNLETTYEHDDSWRRTQTLTMSGQERIFEESLTWSPRNLKVGITRGDLHGQGWILGHDGANRLKHAVASPALTLPANQEPDLTALGTSPHRTSYSYDGAQNLLSRDVVSNNDVRPTSMPPETPGRNRPIQLVTPDQGTISLAYDGAGNLAERADLQFGWDAFGCLVAVKEKNAENVYDLKAEYKCDSQGRRVERTLYEAGQPPSVRETVYNGWQEIEQYRDGLLYERITSASLDRIEALEIDQDLNGVLETYLVPHYDHTGNVVKLTDGNDSIVGRYEISPFGSQMLAYADDTPPEITQILVTNGRLEVEFSEDVDPEESKIFLRLTQPTAGQDDLVASTIDVPVKEGRQAFRRLVVTPTDTVDPGIEIEFVIEIDGVKDLFLNTLTASISEVFNWPDPAAGDTLVVDSTVPVVEELRLRNAHLEIAFSEPPDLAAASQAITACGQTIGWTQESDGYTLRSVSPMAVGDCTVRIDVGLAIDRAGNGLASIFERTITVDSSKPDEEYFVLPDPRQTLLETFYNRFAFHGRPYDFETGLLYFRHRYYDPLMGRFISADPLGYVDGPSMYQFAGSSPNNKTDPLGLYEVDFHYYAVYLVASLALRDHERAVLIAHASQFVDDYDDTKPIRFKDAVDMVFHEEFDDVYAKLRSYHFLAGPVEWPLRRATNGNTLIAEVRDHALETEDDVQVGIMLHSFADSFSHEGFVGVVHERHNTRPGNLYSKLPPLGHLHEGHAVDEPFNDPEKAAEAAYAIYSLLWGYGLRTGSEFAMRLDEESFVKSFVAYFRDTEGSKEERVKAWRRIIRKHGIPVRMYSDEIHPTEGYIRSFAEAASRQRQWVDDHFDRFWANMPQ